MLDTHPLQAIAAHLDDFFALLLAFAVAFLGIAAVVLSRSSQSNRRALDSIRRAGDAVHAMCGEGLIFVDAGGRVVDANDLARELLWGENSELDASQLPKPIQIMFIDPEAQHHRLRIGKNRLIDLALSARSDLKGSLRGILLRDVTEEQRGRRHLLKLANYDSLTGLGNRRLFIDFLESAIEQSPTGDSHIALFYIDIDRFKEINDSFGHGVGDELLKAMSLRLSDEMSEWESDQKDRRGFVARLSGDEFAVVAIGASGEEEIERISESILRRIAETVKTDEFNLNASGSVGVSIFPDDGADVEDLVKAADAALYSAKEQGRGRFVRYEASFSVAVEQTRRIEDRLTNAIERGELQLHYQPKVELDGFTTAGFEALLRWHNDELGSVSPKDFIPIAEERGLISKIGAWCIEDACRQIRVWRDAGYETVPVSVNVSSVQFSESNLQRVVTDALVRHDIEPAAFEIELTESLILDDNDSTALTLRDLRSIGVRIALDDFGTGYSALTYLNRFPLDIVKMDRGFLRGIEDDKAAAGIAAAVVSMSHSLGFGVVAEGVDSERQSRLLKKMGCDQIQGFLYSPPVPATEAARFLATVGSPRPVMDPASVIPEVEDVLEADDSASYGSNPLVETSARALPECRADSESSPTRVLIIDDEDTALGPVALRMVRLGADTHMVQDIDEANLFVNQEAPLIDLLVVSPAIDLSSLALLRETLTKINKDRRPRVLIVAERISEEQRSAFRRSEIDWMLVGHAEDHQLRFFIGAARVRRTMTQTQRCVRVPVDTTVWIHSGGRRDIGTLTSLSRRGAGIETDSDFTVGQSLRLEFKIDEKRIRVFGSVTDLHESGENDIVRQTPSVGVMFFEPERSTEDNIGEIIEKVWNDCTP